MAPSSRGVARTVLVTLALVGLGLLLWAGRNVLFVLFFGALVGLFLSVFTDRLERLGVPRIPALLVVVLGILVILVGSGVLLWPTLRDQLSTVGRDVPQAIGQVGDWLESQYAGMAGELGTDGGEAEEQVRERLFQQVGTAMGGALPILNSALGALAGGLVVLAVGIYTAAYPGLYRNGFERLIPPSHRPRFRTALDRTGKTLRKWMVGTLINMILVGLLTTAGLWILGIPAAIALGVIAGVLEFVPIFGPIMASLPAIAVALTVSPTTALWVAGLYVVIQQIEGNVITPLVMRGTVHLPPALTVLFQTFMAVVFGFLGLLLAVPILAVVLVAVETLYVQPMEASAGTGS